MTTTTFPGILQISGAELSTVVAVPSSPCSAQGLESLSFTTRINFTIATTLTNLQFNAEISDDGNSWYPVPSSSSLANGDIRTYHDIATVANSVKYVIFATNWNKPYNYSRIAVKATGTALVTDSVQISAKGVQ